MQKMNNWGKEQGDLAENIPPKTWHSYSALKNGKAPVRIFSFADDFRQNFAIKTSC